MLKLICLAIILNFFCIDCFSQIKAVTDAGEEVILSENGTWKYANIQKAYNTRLDTPSFTKDAKATFLVKSQTVKCGIWIDPKKWKFKTNKEYEQPVEYIFNMKNNTECMAMNVCERTGMSSTALREFIVEHAKKLSTDFELIRDEPRLVNSVPVRLVEFRSLVKGINLHYLCYLYADNESSIRYMAFTTHNLYKEHEKELETFLNGITLFDK